MMAWTSKSKIISTIKNKEVKILSKPGEHGRAPTLTTMQFTPAQFYGAAARCSFLHTINLNMVGPETKMVATLVREHLSDTGNDFIFLPTVDNFKDYIKSYFTGTVAAALAYLAMCEDGYVWMDHFENYPSGPVLKKKGRSPDFVFSSPVNGTALMESKGTRSTSEPSFLRTLKTDYMGQVYPHIGPSRENYVADHGYCIGTMLSLTQPAKMLICHTPVSKAPISQWSPPGSLPSRNFLKIQKNNYLNAFYLTFGKRSGLSARTSLSRFYWLGKSWITSGGFSRKFSLNFRDGNSKNPRFQGASSDHFSFAIEEGIAEIAP